jgi:hypothetical protein
MSSPVRGIRLGMAVIPAMPKTVKLNLGIEELIEE